MKILKLYNKYLFNYCIKNHNKIKGKLHFLFLKLFDFGALILKHSIWVLI